MGEMIDMNPGMNTIQRIRQTLEDISFIYTYREDLPYDSVICRGKQGTYDEWENQKQDLYRSYNLKHWTGDW